MGRVFISHSSKDGAEAIALRDWMIAQGWDDIFLDLDPQRGIKAGERWQAALRAAATNCEIVLFLISPSWVTSRWCMAEFLLALQMHKRIFGIIVIPTKLEDIPGEMTSEWQLVDLTNFLTSDPPLIAQVSDYNTTTIRYSKDGLNRLRIGLLNAGLDPKYFQWPPNDDPNRQPYRGLRPFEIDDAGIFFGRDGAIIEALDQLRGLREDISPRFFVILGASGAGKSSFLRAGILPRLTRDTQHFLPLRIIRPEHAVISGEEGLATCLESACLLKGITLSRAAILSKINAGASDVNDILKLIVQTGNDFQEEYSTGKERKQTIVLSIDQAEELFVSEGIEESSVFLRLLNDLVSIDNPPVAVLITIRSDNYYALQSSPALENIRKKLFDLPVIAKGSYGELIKGPIRRLEQSGRRLILEDSLVDAILADLDLDSGKDALPLLAFILERLYRAYSGNRHLYQNDYKTLGGLKGSVEAAVECALRAADADPEIPRDLMERFNLLKKGFIPWLAGIDPDTGAPHRRVAKFSEIPIDAQPLLHHFVNQRLLITDSTKETHETTIEVAHEALLRQWDKLRSWLDADIVALKMLEGIKRSSYDWSFNNKSSDWLVHKQGRLEEAEHLLERTDFKATLTSDMEYLKACRVQENLRINAELFKAKKIRLIGYAGVTLSLLLLISSYIAVSNYFTANGQCYVADVYTYATGNFTKTGSQWSEFKDKNPSKQYRIYNEFSQTAQYVYITDQNRIAKIPGREGDESETRGFYVRIPKCGGQAEWSYSNPIVWTEFEFVKPTPLKWYENMFSFISILRWIGREDDVNIK